MLLNNRKEWIDTRTHKKSIFCMMSSMYNSIKCIQLYSVESRSVIVQWYDGEGWLEKMDNTGPWKNLEMIIMFKILFVMVAS